MEFSDLYSEKIIEIAGGLRAMPPLDDPDGMARRTSRICGSVVEVSLTMKDGAVTGYAHDVSACALGQTSAAIVAEHIVGSTVEELRQLRDRMHNMLRNGGPPPEGKWSELKYLEPVRDYPARHASTLLVFDAVADCLDRIEGDSGGP